MQLRSTSSYAHLLSLLRSCIDARSYQTGKLLHARVLRLGLLDATFLCNRLVELYAACGATRDARSAFDATPRKDVYTWNAILGAYCKAGELQSARRLFDAMPERNCFSWNNVISSLVRHGLEREAVEAYRSMRWDGFVPTRFTLASVFRTCSALLDVEVGRGIHGLAVKIGLEKNIYVGNALLCMYAKCGRIEDAIRVFQDLPDPNEVSFTAMMHGLAQTDRVTEAVEMFRLMCRQGMHIDAISLSSVLGVCSSGGYDESSLDGCGGGHSCILQGQQVHSLMIKLGYGSDLHLNNAIIHMYAKKGDMDSAEMIFRNLSEISVVTWNLMIAGYGNKFESDKAIRYMQRMQCCGFQPNEVTFINALVACVNSGNVEMASQVFAGMLFPTVCSWNVMLSGYFQSESHIEVIKHFQKMQFLGVRPDRTSLATILSSCAALEVLEYGRQVHAASLKVAGNADVYVTSGLITMYSNCGKIELAKLILHKIPKLDIVCWNSMMAGLVLNSLDIEAAVLFNKMQQMEMLPTESSYGTMLSCCSKFRSSVYGRQVHAQIVKDGYANNVCVGSALVHMYCKYGDIDDARRFFEMMPYKNTVTWNEMIHGYAQIGFGHEAVCLYENMIGMGVKTDSVTFVAVLTACSHGGLVDAGISILNSMQQDHGVEPLLDHYVCIIDCLGRAGCFSELEVLIDKIPYRDDPVLWEVILSSCRVHANVSLAKKAADELFHLDPQNSAPYLLLANIYCSLGRWDEARAVRNQMNDNQIAKDPGYSWIDIKHEIQTCLGYNPEVVQERIEA
ncbi:pentatricopeptide repeat-containing protein At4g20770 [Eucalyptus grandis]|uniref:pentatricopeptide repeat-containing protein At4g20770 n=1 Tax=Eucalyptus grandis TaxID=71139 RepID=UPI00192F0706|nr:pentatricopeptide repeat-containing protein At4g20770 [Eucalyptus grandis]XP_039168281.1 pentatricopeptide repeat-containing protein At4g20770 [Eucalyptus grandis]XP_039168282.1 pentatricopeptide repeat-containing protein At4g20770 [Eucalyptus grandis]